MARHHTRGYYSPGSGQPTSNPVTNIESASSFSCCELWWSIELDRCGLCEKPQVTPPEVP